MDREIDNREHRIRAIEKMIAEINEKIEAAKKDLENSENNLHKQIILNQLNNRNFTIDFKEFGYDGEEKVSESLRNNTYENSIVDNKAILGELEHFKSILENEYLK